MHGQIGQCFFENGLGKALVIFNAVCDEPIQIIVILHIHGIKIILRIFRNLPDGAHGLDAGEIYRHKDRQQEQHQHQDRQQNGLHFFHEIPPCFRESEN